ncbi:SPT16-domain-containing protein, partial [Microthyrium microscopicum]
MADDGGITMNAEQFHTRLSTFCTAWKNDKRAGDAIFGGAGSIVIPVGKATDTTYTKTASFQMWLFGYEFPSVIMALTPEAFHIIATKKKAKHLEKLAKGKIPVKIYIRAKDAEENEKQFKDLLEVAKSGGDKVGTLTKETPEGSLPAEWLKYWDDNKDGLEEVDIAQAISTAALAIKDETELRSTRDASRASSKILQSYFVEEMAGILDEEKKISHAALASKVSEVIDKDKFWAKQSISKAFDSSGLDWATMPKIYSGGIYDLDFKTEPDQKILHAGTIVAGVGMRYNTYSSLVARSYLVDPTKTQEANYKLLLSVHEQVIKSIKDGVTAKDLYAKAIAAVKAKKPELADKFLKSVGYGIGIETLDSTLQLTAKSARTLKDGMTLVIQTGFTDLDNKDSKDKRNQTYSLTLADTVRVTISDAAIFTKDVSSDWDSVSFFFKDDEEPTPKKVVHRDSRIGGVAQQNIKSTRLRQERQANHDPQKEMKLREHQKELHERRLKQGLEKYSKKSNSANGSDEKTFKQFESYKRDEQIPSKVKEMGICLDQKASTVILPIMGRPVPFHINTIKNASSTSEGDFTSLRINFLSPGQGVGRKDDMPFEDPNAQFVRSLTYRSHDASRMEKLSQQITEMKKEAVRRDQEKKQMEDVIEQDKLVAERRPQKLDNVYLRPNIDTKRVAGHIEIHTNGIRYVHGNTNSQLNRTTVDVLFNNVKHMFFQPTTGEMIVLIHFHLHNPIMIGKRKTKDVQFFREATDMAFDETGTRKRKHRYGDEDEFEQEQEEKRRRNDLDKLFKGFAQKIEASAPVDTLKTDIPIRKLGFNGVPSRSNVLVLPTPDALVQLTEPPFLVVTLLDIEFVHLERVTFGLKNFDMVIIFKDFSRPVQHVNTIPVESLDAVKEWLDSCEIPFHTGTLNLQWNTIMKTVTADPHAFFAEGGWRFLSSESDDEGADESEEESAFEMSGDDFGSEASSEEESDFDENASQDADDDDVSDISEAPSWEELDRKAAAKDRNGDLDEEED